jgi:hypothetical protein
MNGENYVAKTLPNDLKMDSRTVVADCTTNAINNIFQFKQPDTYYCVLSAVPGHLLASSTVAAGQFASMQRCYVCGPQDFALCTDILKLNTLEYS